MTRSRKANDRNHRGLADGSASPEEHLPRFFAKNGYSQDPNGTKRNGRGKGNWGDDGAEMVDEENFNFNHTRRRSNSSVVNVRDFRTKFDVNDQEPVFEESVHGAHEDEAEAELELTKMETTDSSTSSVA